MPFCVTFKTNLRQLILFLCSYSCKKKKKNLVSVLGLLLKHGLIQYKITKKCHVINDLSLVAKYVLCTVAVVNPD